MTFMSLIRCAINWSCDQWKWRTITIVCFKALFFNDIIHILLIIESSFRENFPVVYIPSKG